jgi:hypothetical protein
MIPVAAAVGLSCAWGVSSATAVEDVDCVEHLRQAPIETVTPPDGWTWNTLAWNYGLWTGSVAHEDEDSYSLATLTIACADDAAADMARQQEVRDALEASARMAVVPIGDATDAFRDADRPQIVWRQGAAIASLNIDAQADYAAFEEFASAINESLR